MFVTSKQCFTLVQDLTNMLVFHKVNKNYKNMFIAENYNKKCVCSHVLLMFGLNTVQDNNVVTMFL